MKLIQKEQYAFRLIDTLNIDDLKILKKLTLGDTDMNIKGAYIDLFFLYLFGLEYLTYDGRGNFKIPNEEIRQEFLEMMLYYVEGKYAVSITKMNQVTSSFTAIINAKKEDDRCNQLDNFERLLGSLISDTVDSFKSATLK